MWTTERSRVVPGLVGAVVAGFCLALAATCVAAQPPVPQPIAKKGLRNVLLPSFPAPEALDEAVLFAFDELAFPVREGVQVGLLEGQNPRRVVPTGPKGAADESWGYFTIIRIDGVFHLWVMVYSSTYATQNLAYAHSNDGVHWEKPSLGLVEFNGSKQNNLIESPFPLLSAKCKDVLTDFVVHFDADDPRPERRYKMALNRITAQEHHLCIGYSADGLRWKPGPTKRLSCEMGGVAKFKGRYYMTGQAGMPRRLDIFSSLDFDNWTHLGAGFARDHLPVLEKEKPSHLSGADKWPPAGIGKGEQVHCGAGLWNRGNVLLGVYDAWHGRERDRRLITMDLGLVVSHDGVHYREPVPSFLLIDARKQPAAPKEQGPALTHGQAMENGCPISACLCPTASARRRSRFTPGTNSARAVSWRPRKAKAT